MAAWSVNGAIAMQTSAHERLMKAIENKTGYYIYFNGCQITTAESLRAAQLYVGKSKRYTIVPMSQA